MGAIIPKLERLRASLGLTQRSLGAKINASHDVIWRAENGRRIKRKFADRLVRLSRGVLAIEDFFPEMKTRKAGKNGRAHRGKRRAGAPKVIGRQEIAAPDQEAGAGRDG